MLAIHWQTSRAYCRGRYGLVLTAPAGKEELARFLTGGFDVTVKRLPSLLRHLKPVGLTGVLLAQVARSTA